MAKPQKRDFTSVEQIQDRVRERGQYKTELERGGKPLQKTRKKGNRRNMNGEGWILLYKKFQQWEWYNYPTVKIIFLHCLLEANFKEETWQGQKIKRGQFPTSIEKLATLNGLTLQQTRNALKKLQTTNEINIQTTNRYSIITVKNYDLYQTSNKQKTQSNNKRKQGGCNKQIGGSNNNTIKNNKEDIYITSNIYNSSSSIEKIKLTEEEEELLKKFSKRVDRKIKNYRLWREKVIQSGGYLDILKEEKERQEKLKISRQQQELNFPPEKIEPEDEEITAKAMRKARTQVMQAYKVSDE